MAAEIAAPQHGVVARRQLVRAGLTSSAIEHDGRGRQAPPPRLSRGVRRGPPAGSDLKLVAELDGYAFHSHRRAFVLATAGWQSVRVTDHQLYAKRAATAERFGLLLNSRVS